MGSSIGLNKWPVLANQIDAANARYVSGLRRFAAMEANDQCQTFDDQMADDYF